MILGDGSTSEELFRYAGRASTSGGREQEAREVAVMGRKWKVEVCPSLRWFVQVTPDWRDAQWHAYSSDSSAEWRTLCLCSLPRHDEAALEEQRRGWVSVYGAVEEWLPGVELKDESRTGILFCQLECANGNVRAAGKLMNLIGEMPPLSPNAWSIAIVSAGRQCFSLLFFDCFLRLAWLFCGYKFDGELWVEEIKESIRDRDQCFHLLLTSAGPVKSDFGLESSNSVSKVNINKRGCAMQPPKQSGCLCLGSQLKTSIQSCLFPFSDIYTLMLNFPEGNNREQVVSLQLSK